MRAASIAASAAALAVAALGPASVRGLVTVGIGVAVCVGGVGAIRKNGGESKRPWVLVHIGAVGLLTSFVIRGVHAALSGDSFPFPSPADALAVPSYALVILGEFALARARRDRAVRANTLDALIVASASGFALWTTLLAPLVVDTSLAVPVRALDAVYSFLDVCLIAATALLAFGPGRRNRTYHMLAGAIAALFCLDVLVYMYNLGYPTDTLFSALASLAFLLYLVALTRPDLAELSMRMRAPAPRLTLGRLVAMATALAIAPGLMLVRELTGEGPPIAVYLVGSLCLSALVLARLVELFRSKEVVANQEATLRSAANLLLGASDPAEVGRQLTHAVLDVVGRVTVRSVDLANGAGETIGRWDHSQPDPNEDPAASGDLIETSIELGEAGGLRLSLATLRPVSEDLVQTLHALLDQAVLALRSLALRDELFRERADRRFKTLVENSTDIVMVLNGHDQVSFVSPAVMLVLGRSEDDLMSTGLRMLAHGEHRVTVDRFLHATRAGTSLKPVEVQMRRADGALRWFELLGRDHSDNDEIDGLVVTARDVTDRRAADDRLARSEARFRSLVQHSSDVIAVIDGSGFFAFVTPSVTSVLGYRPDSLVGSTVFDLVAPGHRDRVEERLALMGEPFTRVDLEVDVKAASGRYHTLVVTLTDLRDEPAVDGIVLNARDITTHRSLEKDLEHQSITDPLTGLPNRTGFIDTLQAVLDNPNAPSPTVLLLDLDDFKMINDSLGHSFGDEILTVVADRLRTSLRLSDHAARLGGDEFAILLRDAYTQTDVQQVTERLLEDLRAPLLMNGEDLSLSASIGVAMAGDADSAEDLIRNADAAMYRAKDAGKNRFEMFEEQIHADMLERLELKNDLRRGISNDELVLHFQPIVNLATDRITGAEALVRWHHPRRGVLAPGAFIEMAEESGLINRIGLWVFEQACEQVMEWNARRNDDEPLTMSINLSARQLETDESVDQLLAVAERLDVPRNMIVLELTESVLIEDLADRARLARLQSEGFRLAVDDFGTGYSGLAYLQHLPFDIIKVDRAFVSGVDTNVNRATFLESILDLAKGVGATTVGEGIEGGGELDLLKKLGFDYGQGYYFSRPVPSETFAMMIGLEQQAVV